MKPEKRVLIRVGGHCNIIITQIQLCAFVGLNSNNWTVIHGMVNVKHFVLYTKVRAVWVTSATLIGHILKYKLT